MVLCIIKADRQKGNGREIIARENRPEIYFWREMVFCYQSCSDLLWKNIVLVIEKKKLKFEAEGQEFVKFLRWLEQFIQTVKGQSFGNRMLFIVPRGFSYLRN